MDITSSNTKRTKSIWSKLIIIFSILLVILLIAGISYVHFRSYPRFVTSLKDKYKYILSLPNDKLINQLYGQTFVGSGLDNLVVASKKDDGGGLLQKIYSDSYGFEEERNTYDVNRSYIVLDTIHTISEIQEDSTYLFYHIFQGYRLQNGKEAIEYYNTFFSPELKEKYSAQDHCLLLCSKYNLKNRIDTDSEISKFLLTVPASNMDVANKCFFFIYGKINLFIDYLQMCLKHQSKNVELWEECLDMYLYLDNDNDRIEQIANNILELDANNEFSYYALARSYANRKDWNNALKYSRLALDYGETNYVKADCHLITAWALYNTGDKEKAIKEYNIGYNDGSLKLRDKYKECAGCPFEINDIEISFTDSKGNVITDYGIKLYSKNSMFITPRLNLHALRRFEDEVVYIKIFDSTGSLSKSNGSPSGYTLKDEISCIYYDGQTSDKKVELIGWGASNRGNWQPGIYRVEIWYEGELIRGKDFIIY